LRLTFNEYVLKTYGATKGQTIIDKVDWIAWVQTPGPIPPNSNINYTTVNTTAFQNLADEYISLGGSASPKNMDLYLNETKDVNLKVVFTSQLLNRLKDVNYKIVQRIDQDLNITNGS
jgi:hypothetical protein